MEMDTKQHIKGSLIVIGQASHDVHAERLERLGGLPEQVVIIDPLLDPDKPHSNCARGTANTAFIPAAIATIDSSAECSIWPALGLHSLHEPNEALRTLFPGLQRRRSQKVETLSIRTLLGRLGTLPDPIRVWIDMPGSEATILDGLAQTNIISRITTVALRCGIEPFFMGSHAAADLTKRLEAHGFAMCQQACNDPDFPDLIFEAPHQLREAPQSRPDQQLLKGGLTADGGALSAQLAAAKAQADDLMAENRLLQEQVQGQQTEIETLLKERDERQAAQETNAATLAELQEQVSLLTTQEAASRAQHDDLITENQRLQEQVQGQQTEIETLLKERDERQAAQETNAATLVAADTACIDAQSAAEKISALKTELKAATKERHDMWEARNKARTELSDARNEIETLQAEVQELQHRQSLARNELHRAEGQVELIKDLLLRETTL